MDQFKVLKIKQNVFEDNNRQAEMLRKELKGNKTFLLNLMSSPGSGKTTTLIRTINGLKDEMNIGVMEADIDSDVLLINKIDAIDYFEFDLKACIERVKHLNPNVKVITISAKTGEGIEEWNNWLRHEVKQWMLVYALSMKLME